MKKVLIVDDATVMRMMLKDILEKNGFEVVGEAKNGYEARDLYKEVTPDIVTMDISMPDCDGIEGIKLIKEIDNEAKIIMISALGQKEQVLESIKLGAKDFIVKPFDETNVVDTMKRVAQ